MWTALALLFLLLATGFLTKVTVKHKQYKQGKSNEVVAFIMMSVAANSLGMFFTNAWSLGFYGLGFALLLIASVLAIKANFYLSSITKCAKTCSGRSFLSVHFFFKRLPCENKLCFNPLAFSTFVWSFRLRFIKKPFYTR